MRSSLLVALQFVCYAAAGAVAQTSSHTLAVAPGQTITLALPAEFDIHVAASNLKRPRFFAQSPDGRIFVTTMFNLADNTHGAIWVLDGWDATQHRFTRTTPFVQHLRNPNNIAFYTDPAGSTWLYVPLTDRLVRYRFHAGDRSPSSPPQVLMRFPDYGLNYKYGGWHLTRTVAIATLHGRTQVYVAAGSSCNYCQEREAQRAAVVAMDPDGRNPHIVAHGLRNAVDLRFIPEVDGGGLFATNMGDDHLGDRLPEDTFFELDSNARPGPLAQTPAPNYGWPTCFFANGKPVHDDMPLPASPGEESPAVAPRPASSNDPSVYGHQQGVAAAGTNLAARIVDTRNLPDLGPVPQPLGSCGSVPAAYTTFAAHSSPLGMAYFDGGAGRLNNFFLIALHGAGHPRIGTGYKVIALSANGQQTNFVTGFLTVKGSVPVVHGRPCGLIRTGPQSFLLTDDKLGLIYEVEQISAPANR